MSRILKQKNYQVIPFVFERNMEEIANDIEKNIGNKRAYDKKKEYKKSNLRWKLKAASGKHLFSYIDNLILEENIKSRIGIALELDIKESDCSKLGISENNKLRRVIRKNKSEYEFKYNFINVYLFETGVGFLVYSLEFCDDNQVEIDHIIDGNYYYKKYNEDGIYEGYSSEINKMKKSVSERKSKLEGELEQEIRKKHETRIKTAENELSKTEALEQLVYYDEKSSKKDRSTRRYRWVNLILEDLNLGEIEFIGTEGKPSYSHVFSYINLEEKTSESDIQRYLYWLKNSYKRTYKPTQEILSDKNQEGYLNLFENIWWGASIEGLSCITRYTSDDKLTNQFIDTYNGNIESTYLYMYILMLHMRYALLKYIIEAADINKEVKNYKDSDINKINELKEKIILLDLRCIFNDVSNISSQVKVFDMMRESLRIDRLNEELYREIENLSQLANIYYQNNMKKYEKEKKRILDQEKKRNEKREKQKRESLDFISYFIGLFSVSSFIKDVVEDIKIFQQYYWLYHIVLFISLLTLLFVFNRIKKRNYD